MKSLTRGKGPFWLKIVKHECFTAFCCPINRTHAKNCIIDRRKTGIYAINTRFLHKYHPFGADRSGRTLPEYHPKKLRASRRAKFELLRAASPSAAALRSPRLLPSAVVPPTLRPLAICAGRTSIRVKRAVIDRADPPLSAICRAAAFGQAPGDRQQHDTLHPDRAPSHYCRGA